MKTRIYFMLFLHSFSAGAYAISVEESKNQHVQYWMKTLESHPLVLIRKQAARHLGAMEDPVALPSLIKGLADSADEVKIQSAYSLGRLGNPDALRPLYELIQTSKDSQVQSAARNAIEKINAHEEFLRTQKQKLQELENKTKS